MTLSTPHTEGNKHKKEMNSTEQQKYDNSHCNLPWEKYLDPTNKNILYLCNPTGVD